MGYVFDRRCPGVAANPSQWAGILKGGAAPRKVRTVPIGANQETRTEIGTTV
jgi:hypothetical protein